MQKSRRFIIALIGIVLVVCCLLIVALILFGTQFTTHQLEGNSMAPTLASGDLIVASKAKRDLKRGEIVVYEVKGRSSIHRVVAVAGDEIEFTEEGLLINGNPEQGDYQPQGATFLTTSQYFKLTEKYQVPEGQYLLLGDNRASALDSRSNGFIKREDIKAVYWRSI